MIAVYIIAFVYLLILTLSLYKVSKMTDEEETDLAKYLKEYNDKT